jgi:hypothetical protein
MRARELMMGAPIDEGGGGIRSHYQDDPPESIKTLGIDVIRQELDFVGLAVPQKPAGGNGGKGKAGKMKTDLKKAKMVLVNYIGRWDMMERMKGRKVNTGEVAKGLVGGVEEEEEEEEEGGDEDMSGLSGFLSAQEGGLEGEEESEGGEGSEGSVRSVSPPPRLFTTKEISDSHKKRKRKDKGEKNVSTITFDAVD